MGADLLTWYDAHRRDLPWRAKPGVPSIPYRVWLSEIMLQQTTVAAVGPYFRAFLKRWPTVTALANAELDEVLSAWAGLGYYSRARNLHKTAKIIANEYRGRFPQHSAELLKLPGIGRYTAGAVAAIAFGERVAALEANGERVLARLFALREPVARIKARLSALADALVPVERPGDFAQALMDLGAGLCVPKRPVCARCPLALHCRGLALGIAEQLPVKAPKRVRPLRRGAAYVAFDRLGAVHLVRRPEKGLLGGMLQPPLGDWIDAFPDSAKAIKAAPFPARWTKVPGFVRHSFTHFHLELEVYVAYFERRPNSGGVWLAREKLRSAALPTAMLKLIRHAMDYERTGLA